MKRNQSVLFVILSCLFLHDLQAMDIQNKYGSVHDASLFNATNDETPHNLIVDVLPFIDGALARESDVVDGAENIVTQANCLNTYVPRSDNVSIINITNALSLGDVPVFNMENSIVIQNESEPELTCCDSCFDSCKISTKPNYRITRCDRCKMISFECCCFCIRRNPCCYLSSDSNSDNICCCMREDHPIVQVTGSVCAIIAVIACSPVWVPYGIGYRSARYFGCIPPREENGHRADIESIDSRQDELQVEVID